MATPVDPLCQPQPQTGSATLEYYVVCADDDADFVKSLELFLPERINEADSDAPFYNFIFFTDPREAIEAIREIRAGSGVLAMVISDQQMPQMKGTAFLAQVRKHCPDCICVLLTGHAGLDSAITAINERLLDKYVTKPIENDHEFTVSVQHLLQRFQMQRTIEHQHQTIGDLYRFANMLNSIGDLEQTLDQVIAFTSSALRCPQAAIFLLEGGELVLRASNCGPENGLPTRTRLETHQIQELRSTRGATRADRQEQVSWLDGQGGSTAFGPFEPPLIQAALASGETVLGVIVAGGKAPGAAITDKDVEILTFIADTASVAVQNQLQHRALGEAYTETRNQAAALATANERLQVLDRLKSDFLTFVCHELRTPLTALAAIDLLKPGPADAQQAEVIQLVRVGYGRLEEFIQRGLAYVDRITTGNTESWEVADFASIVREVLAATPALGVADVDLKVSYPKDACMVKGNRADLIDVVGILLDNAVRFSPREKWIRVSLEARGENLLFEVSDRGSGFAPEMAEEIFRPFTIADSSHHGTGCALSLAKAASIIKDHAGEIRAKSAGLERGATLSVTLPLAGVAGGSVNRTLSPRPDGQPDRETVA